MRIGEVGEGRSANEIRGRRERREEKKKQRELVGR